MGEETSLQIDLSSITIDRRIAQILPEEVVRRNNMLPIKIEEENLYVVTTAPLNLPGLDEVKLLTGLRVKPLIVSKNALIDAINDQFNIEQVSRQAIVDMTLQELGASRASAPQQEILDINEAPVVALANQIIKGAVNDRASDIHLEPQLPEMIVRYRINGLLHDITTVPEYIKPSIISRIKLLAEMDITERRRPQDGHITMNVNQKQVDLRISSVSTINGEKIVIRVLDKETMLVDIRHLGLSDTQQNLFKKFISHPYGMILVTGPTGSGKSTTLYAALKEMDALTKNIITVENPVEYQMPRISQIQVNPNIGFTFATALRTIVRQDPDVIMVGEIRDTETADIAIQAALTGHLVLSTLHTNDAPGAVVRLLDMGVQPFLTASSVVGVIAQRLVRTICPECKEFYQPSDMERETLELNDRNIKLARGRGCDFCHGTGYRGRKGVYEVFEVDEDIRRLIIAQVPSSEIKKAALEKGMKSLSDMGKEKAIQGISTLDEIQRVVFLDEDKPEEKRKNIISVPAEIRKEDNAPDRSRETAATNASISSAELIKLLQSFKTQTEDYHNLNTKLVGDDLMVFIGNQLVATHKISGHKKDHPHLMDAQKPNYSGDVETIKELFLTYFPEANQFLDGLARAKDGRTRYHIVRILSLLEEYPRSKVETAIERATLYGAFEYNAIKNICRQEKFVGIYPEKPNDLEASRVAGSVEERSLSCYSEFEG